MGRKKDIMIPLPVAFWDKNKSDNKFDFVFCTTERRERDVEEEMMI